MTLPYNFFSNVSPRFSSHLLASDEGVRVAMRFTRRRLPVLLPIVSALLILSSPGLAQKPPAQQPTQRPDDTVRIGVTDVRLPVSVLDKKDRFIFELTKEDFEVLEDKRQQEIKHFQANSQIPLDIAILMDTSSSVRGKLKFEKESAASFVQTVLQRRRDRVLFTTFDNQVTLHQDFTDSTELLTKAIESNKIKANGETRLYDAIYRVCEEKMGTDRTRRGVIIIISDGDDTISDRTLEDAVNISQKREVTIYAISTKAGGFFGVAGGTVKGVEDKALQRLCDSTGGRLYFPSDQLGLERDFRGITDDVRNQYIIVYEPDNQNFDGSRRSIEVKVVNPKYKDMKVRSRRGYIAGSPTASKGGSSSDK